MARRSDRGITRPGRLVEYLLGGVLVLTLALVSLGAADSFGWHGRGPARLVNLGLLVAVCLLVAGCDWSWRRLRYGPRPEHGPPRHRRPERVRR
jgi:hypothetical protein